VSGVDAVIVCVGPLDKSEATLHNLDLKICNCLREMASDNFAKQFGSGPNSIFVSCSQTVSFEARQLVAKLALEAARGGSLFLLVQGGRDSSYALVDTLT